MENIQILKNTESHLKDSKMTEFIQYGDALLPQFVIRGIRSIYNWKRRRRFYELINELAEALFKFKKKLIQAIIKTNRNEE